MNLILTRKDERIYGIFGELANEKGEFICMTLEHAYYENGLFVPKLPSGTYQCVRGPHRLEGMDAAFDTFEVMEVPGHTGILFHVGNYNRDSNGCILVGEFLGGMENGGKMITNSKKTFEKLMKLQDGVDSFLLKVE